MKVPCMKLECQCLSASHGLKKGAEEERQGAGRWAAPLDRQLLLHTATWREPDNLNYMLITPVGGGGAAAAQTC